MAEVSYEIREDVAVLTMIGQPVVMTADMRRHVSDAVTRARADGAAQAILIQSRGSAFCEGASLSEYDQSEATPTLQELCSQVEDTPLPVLAVLHGAARGPGFELALAAHYRIAEKETRLAMPEVSLGLLPSGGTTQRLPRLLGAEAAISFLLTPRGLRASEDAARRLIDAQFSGDRTIAGLAFLRKLRDDGKGPNPTRARREGFREPTGYQHAVATAAAAADRHPEVARRDLVRAVEAAQLLPFDVGLSFEAELAEDRRQGRQSVFLRHLFRAERQAQTSARASGGSAARIDRLGIVGGGAMALGLAVLALRSGRTVALHSQTSHMAERFSRQIADVMRAMGVTGDWGKRLSLPADLSGLSGAELVVETTGAEEHVVADVLGRAAGSAGNDPFLATTIPGNRLGDLARSLGGHAPRLVGLALRNPVHLSRLVEISASEQTSADALASVAQLVRQMGRVGIVTTPRAMPAGQEMFRTWQAMALALSDQGIHPHDVDAALQRHGHAAGPFMTMDAEGLGTVKSGLQVAGLPLSRTLGGLIEAGRLGRDAGQGMYHYPEATAAPVPDETLTGVLPVPPRQPMPDAAIVHLCNAALVNCGARLIRRGVVERPGDLDVAMVAGWGYPRLAGGPMKSADLSGLFSIQRLLEQFARTTGERSWMPDRTLRDMVKNGRRFFG